MSEDKIVIVDGVRTAIGRYGGTLKDVNSGELATHVIRELLTRTKLDPALVDEVILGEARQTTESSNVARVAALRAGVPVDKPAFTINRLCASGMQAITSGVQQIQSEQADIIVAGGTESLSQAAIYVRDARFGGDKTYMVDSNLEAGQQPKEVYGEHMGMGVTAENVAEKYDVSREDQDAFAAESQRRAEVAIENNIFKDEIVPYVIQNRKETIVFDTDEHPRSGVTAESLSKLRPAFKKGGSVTAGNACGRNDGAAALVIMKESRAKELKLTPRAAIVDWAAAGVAPEIMGIGPIPAIEKLLERTNMSIEDIDLFEVNEAFASQALTVQRELNIDPEKLNVNGGAIALGHPLGATGTRIVMTLINELRRQNKRYGIASLCIGGGQGMAILVENLEL